MTASTPFARWRTRMGDRAGLKRPIGKREAAELIGYSINKGTEFDRAPLLPITVALACAALENGLTPIE